MNTRPSLLGLSLLALLASPAAHAEIPIDSIAGSDIGFEGLLQADGYWYDSDVLDLDADAGDGMDHDFGLRRAELAFKGKGPGNFECAAGYAASGDGKFLDVVAKYKLGGNSGRYLQLGQPHQPNSVEELSSCKNNHDRAQAMATNPPAVPRRLGIRAGLSEPGWGVTASICRRELTRDRAHGSGYAARA